MAALRFVAVVALALWIGGLVALGAVGAPVLFDVLPAHDPNAGRSLAGLAFGAMLESYDRLSLLFGAVVALTLAWRTVWQRPRGLLWRSGVLAAMLTATGLTSAVIGPRIDAIRAATAGAVADLPDTDPTKVTFGRLHGLSGGLMLGTIIGGLALCWREISDR